LVADSVVTMDECVRNFMKFTGKMVVYLFLSRLFAHCHSSYYFLKECSIVEAVEAASLHPAQVLGIATQKGTLNAGADADFVLLDSDMRVRATFVGGALAWSSL
jgi:N-acetylglucosamine-6-phosphate deacetylase